METEVIRISVSEDKDIMELLSRMYEIKNKENKDVECEYKGKIVTTKECNTFEDLLIKNNDIIFNSFEQEKENLLKSPEMQEAIEKFKNRGKKYDGSEIDPSRIASNIWENTKEFEKKIAELETLDFSNSTDVYLWLDSIIKFVNNHDLYLAPGLDKSEYKTSTNYIVKKLEEKGYSNEINQINNLDDYYKRLISYQLDDLVKYGFFAYDYAYNLENNKTVSENITEEKISDTESKLESTTIEPINLEELISKQKQLTLEINLCNEMIEGTQRRNNENKFVKSISFEEEKAQLKQQIEEIEKNEEAKIDKPQIIVDARNAVNRVKTIESNSTNLTVDEQNALKSFYNTEIFPNNNEFINALDLAMKLPKESAVRESLIDAIIKLSTRYNLNKDQEEKEELALAFEKLGVKTSNNKNNELENLKIQYVNLEKEQEIAKERLISKLETKKLELDEVNKELEKNNNSIDTKSVVEDKTEEVKNDASVDIEPVKEENKEAEIKSTNDGNTSFISKLEQIANEGPVFVDLETRLDKTDQWMDKNTAITLGKLDSSHKDVIKSPTEEKEEIIKNESIEVVENQEDLPMVQEDSLAIPHPIKSVKKASIKLIEKVRGIEFGKKIKQGLDFIKEKVTKYKKAVATVLIIGGIAMLGGRLNDANEVVNNNVSNDTKTESMDQIDENVTPSQPEIETPTDNPVVDEEPEIEETKTNAELMNEAIEETIDGILNGDDVYSNKYNALNETNGLTTSTSQKENSWANSEATVFYDENAEILNRDQAEEAIANGKEVVARFDNNGVPIGYAVVGNSSNIDASGISK